MSSSFIDKNGYRRQRANPISCVGVFPYTGAQIDYDGEFGLDKDKLYWVYRGPEALFEERAIESFQGLPIRVGHVMLGSRADSVSVESSKENVYRPVDEEPADGCIYNVRPSKDEPGILIAEFAIWTDKMKDILKEGKIKELSLGYTCRYEPCEGVYNGIPYQFKQVNLTGNHLALVKHGRCGSSVCVCDEAVVTFDSLPEGITQMEDTKKEEKKPMQERVKALATAIKGGDEQGALDCLDFYELTPAQRKEALEYIKSKKCDKKECEKTETVVGDKKDIKPAKDAGDVPPPPPETTKPEAPAESPAPAASTASAPASEPAPEAGATPPENVPSPKDGEMPAGDKKEKCAKDCGTGVTEPSIPVPVAAVEELKEKKEEVKTEDTAPACEKKEEPKEEKTEEVKEVKKEEPEKTPETEKPVTDSLGAGKPPALGPEPTPALGKEKTDEPKNPEKITQDAYEAFAREYANAQALAGNIRAHVTETFDSTTWREIDVARFAAKHIPCLAFVADDANDDIVLAAVRGFVACGKLAPVADAAPKTEDEPKGEPKKEDGKKEEPAKPVAAEKVEVKKEEEKKEEKKEEKTVSAPAMDSMVFEDYFAMPSQTKVSPCASARDLAEFLSK